MASLIEAVRRFWSALAFELRPWPRFTLRLLAPMLRDRLLAEDGPDKKAVIIGLDSVRLADLLGLHQAQRLVLPYPDFTPENLALLSNEYDFVVADRMLHRCASPQDAGREIVRVLKKGGWFVCTTCLLDVAVHGSAAVAHASGRRLRALFPNSEKTTRQRAIAACIIGRRKKRLPAIEPSVAAKIVRWPAYRFDPRPAKFGIVATHRNEAPYLLEWIAYHRLLGFQQITIYDNESNDASARILAPLAQAGIINVQPWHRQRGQQAKAYNHALEKLRGRLDWCLYLDLDEFLVLDEGCTLDSLLPNDQTVCAVAIPWLVFTSAGARHRGTDLTIARFTRAARLNDRHVKSLVRLRDVSQMGIHLPVACSGRVVDIGGVEIGPQTSGALPHVASGMARINHYFTRSWEEFEFKRMRGRAYTTGVIRAGSDFNLAHREDMEVRDILRCLPALRREIAHLRSIVGWAAKP